MFLCVFGFYSLPEGQGAFYRPGGGQITTSYYFYIYEGIYMTSGAQTRDSRFIEVGWSFPRCSRQFQSLLLGTEVNDT
jgi:hypothetical protein